MLIIRQVRLAVTVGVSGGHAIPSYCALHRGQPSGGLQNIYINVQPAPECTLQGENSFYGGPPVQQQKRWEFH